MSTNFSHQTMALAGIFQAASLVDQLAKLGQLENDQLTNALKTVLNSEPSSFDDVFNGLSSLSHGLTVLNTALARNGQGVGREVLQYAMAIIAVQTKLNKRPDLVDELSKALTRTADQQRYFDSYTHEAVIGSAARCYQNSISQLNFRIRVTGNPSHLQNPKVAEKVRTLLLYGVRCALLWQQSGGRRWHLMWYREKLQRSAQALTDVA
ncbi:high frequency lysogenization protein HflD [Reinekea sp.]|uniref:high frequency lysogenization protein HflD n=1 Tax=Reinekea sp. TaxID=1970455 RepID=UPI002A81D03F|nr:high frequency lysogenization protein HflD [Reinekea sp.]